MQDSEYFNQFWQAYPRKVGKHKARSAWFNQGCETSPAPVLAGLKRWVASPQWTKDGGRYIPHPTTWLNRHGWEDEIEIEVKRPQAGIREDA